jgi:hypothetical protein
MGQESWVDAVKDMQLALSMCQAGDAQAELISGKLAEAREHAPDAPDPAPTPEATTSYNDGSVVIEDVTDCEPEVQGAAATKRGATIWPAASTPQAAQQRGAGASEYMARVMQNDPQFAQRMMHEMSNQSPEELERMAHAAGMTGFDASTAKQVRNVSRAALQARIFALSNCFKRMSLHCSTEHAPQLVPQSRIHIAFQCRWTNPQELRVSRPGHCMPMLVSACHWCIACQCSTRCMHAAGALLAASAREALPAQRPALRATQRHALLATQLDAQRCYMRAGAALA